MLWDGEVEGINVKFSLSVSEPANLRELTRRINELRDRKRRQKERQLEAARNEQAERYKRVEEKRREKRLEEDDTDDDGDDNDDEFKDPFAIPGAENVDEDSPSVKIRTQKRQKKKSRYQKELREGDVADDEDAKITQKISHCFQTALLLPRRLWRDYPVGLMMRWCARFWHNP